MLKFSETKFRNQLLLNGLTSKEVAKITGLTEMTISRAVTGKVNPKPATIGKLAKALNCMPADLLQEVEE